MNLGLLQLADSAIPISGYTHSWGLESAILQGKVRDAAALESWSMLWLEHALGPLEGALVARAAEAAATRDSGSLVELNGIAEVSMAVPTIRRASQEMGTQLLTLSSTWEWSRDAIETLRRDTGAWPETWHHCVAFGLLGSIAGAGTHDILMAYLHQAALGMVSAGVRAIPVGHTHGQQILAYLHPVVARLAGRLSAPDAPPPGSGCPFYEVLCNDQVQLYARMFRS